jgi:NTP pyrophosphatase (non-canonical NTP hydrolase)
VKAFFEDYDSEYARFVDRLFVNRSLGDEGLVHSAIGIAGEAGEILDAIKKIWVYNAAIDRENLIEELGDLEFYMQALRTRIGVSRTEVINANVSKLQRRYPKGYTDRAARERLDKAA